jgi:hypothetical protein
MMILFQTTYILEVVNDFIYLGSLISDTGSSQKQIKRRIMLGRVAMKKLRFGRAGQ